MSRKLLVAGSAALVAAGLAASCRLPDFAAAGAAANVVATDRLAYAALGAEGIAIHEIATGRRLALVAPLAGMESVDDLALADGWLFALDARAPGRLASFALETAGSPRPVGAPVEAPVGPFSGIAAAAGRIVVSGGTSELTIWRHDSGGAIASDPERLDLGRGQPDVTLSPDGRLAVVSTHFSLVRDTFGITLVDLTATPPRVTATVEIAAAGFTPGGARPASFPLTAALDGTLLHVAHGGGLTTFDVADPAQPIELATLDCGFHPVGVSARGRRIAVVGSDPAPSLLVLHREGAGAPVELLRRRLDAGARPTAVAIGGEHAVVAALEGGLAFVDLAGK